jgi:hypothetical protein
MKSKPSPKNQQKGKTQSLRVQTDIRAGREGEFNPLQRVEEMINKMQASFGTNF